MSLKQLSHKQTPLYRQLKKSLRLSTTICPMSSSNMSDITYVTLLNLARNAFDSAVAAVKPATLMKNHLRCHGNTLQIKGKEYHLKKPCHVVGFGKAVLEMAIETECILGTLMKSGTVSVPLGSVAGKHLPAQSKIRILEGAPNNLPDTAALQSAIAIQTIAKSLNTDDTLLVLISGGGSALLPLPCSPVTLEEKLKVIKLMANAGANINQLNCVRKHLSSVKGGKLARVAYPAKCISLILSDVVRDPLDIIASGPTVHNEDPPTAAWDTICEFGLEDKIPKSVKDCLKSKGNAYNSRELNVENVVIGNNILAIEAAVLELNKLGGAVVSISSEIEGNVTSVAQFYAELAALICEHLYDGKQTDSLFRYLESKRHSLHLTAPDQILDAVNGFADKKFLCLIGGGETTVQVSGDGVGGRNQELALRFAEQIKIMSEKQNDNFNCFKVGFLSAGTDGIDGPTNAAGAFGYAEQIRARPDYHSFLRNNDSHTFYSTLFNGQNLIITGHTGTNVMDLHFLMISRNI